MSIFSRRGTRRVLVMLYDLTLSRVSMRSPLFIIQGSCDLVFSYGIFFVYLFLLFMSDLHACLRVAVVLRRG